MRGVGGAVHRVEHHHHLGVGPVQARLLGQDAQSGRVQDLERGGVGGQIAAVLAGSSPGQRPVVEPTQGGVHRLGGLVEPRHQGVVVHGPPTVAARPPPWQA